MGGYYGYDDLDYVVEEEEAAAAPPPAAPAAEAPVAAAPPPAAPAQNVYSYDDQPYTYDEGAGPEQGAAPLPAEGYGSAGGYAATPPSLEAEEPPPAAPQPQPEEQGPGFFDRLGSGITELPGNAKDALVGLFTSEEPPPAAPPRDQGRDLAEAQRQRQAAEEAGRFIDSDVQGPGERLRQAASDPGAVLGAAGGVKDDLVRWAGDVVEDPKGSLGAAKDALVDDGLRNFERGLDYSKNVINQDQAAILARELETGQSGLQGTSPGDQYYANNPMRQAALADPELGARMLDAYHQGYTREDGTYIEPGERAMQIAYYEPLDTGQKIKQDLYADPFLIPATVATMGAGGAAQGVARIPKVGRLAAPLVKHAPEAIDTVGNLGLNLAVPKAVGGVTKAGKAVGLFRPSAQAVDRMAVEEGFEAAEQLQQAMREAGSGGQAAEAVAVRTNAWNELDYVPQTTYRTPEDIPITSLTAGPGQQPLLRDVMNPLTNEIMPAGSPRLQWAVGHQRRFVVEQGVDGTSWFVKENLKGAPEYAKVFNLAGSEWARNPSIRDRVVSETPMQDAINFAKGKTLEWQDRGLSDPVTFQWGPREARRAAPVDEHARYSRSGAVGPIVMKEADSERLIGDFVANTGWRLPKDALVGLDYDTATRLMHAIAARPLAEGDPVYAAIQAAKSGNLDLDGLLLDTNGTTPLHRFIGDGRDRLAEMEFGPTVDMEMDARLRQRFSDITRSYLPEGTFNEMPLEEAQLLLNMLVERADAGYSSFDDILDAVISGDLDLEGIVRGMKGVGRGADAPPPAAPLSIDRPLTTYDGRPIERGNPVTEGWSSVQGMGGRDTMIERMAGAAGVEPSRVGRIIGLAERNPDISTDVFRGEGADIHNPSAFPPDWSAGMLSGEHQDWALTASRSVTRKYDAPSDVGIYTDSKVDEAVAAEYVPLLRQMREHLDRYGLEQTDLSIVRNIGEEFNGQMLPDEAIAGMFSVLNNRPHITIAAFAASVKKLHGSDPYSYRRALAGTLDHEVIHAMKRADVFSPDEWDTLAQAAHRMFTDPDEAISDLYGGHRLDLSAYRPDQREEEMVARLFEAFARNQTSLTKAVPPGLLERAMQIVNAAIEWVAGIGRIAEEEGAEDILRTIWEGGYANRTRKAWNEEMMLDPALLRPDGSIANRSVSPSILDSPPKPGMVRLYRGEKPDMPDSHPETGWWDQNKKERGLVGAYRRWYTQDLDEALEYAAFEIEQNLGAVIRVVDVPEEVAARSWLDGPMKAHPAAKESLAHHAEFILPDEYTAASEVLPDDVVRSLVAERDLARDAGGANRANIERTRATTLRVEEVASGLTPDRFVLDPATGISTRVADGARFSRSATEVGQPAWTAEDAYRWQREPYNWAEESREDLVRFMDENPDILHAPRLVDQGMPDPTGTIRRDPSFTVPMDRDMPWRALVANWFDGRNDGVQTMGIIGNIHEYERVEREFGPFVEQIRERIDRYGLDQVALEVAAEVRITRGPNAGTPVGGYWDAYDGAGMGTIAIAVGHEMQLAFNKLIFDVNVGEIVDHEVIHAMRSARAFSDEEWDAMVDAARRWTESDDASGFALDAREKVASSLYDVHDRDEERVANLFAAWNKNQTKLRHAMPSDIFDRIDRIFQAAWDFLNGFVSVLKNDPDVVRMFSDIAEGKYADKVRAGLALNAQDTANIPRRSPSPSSLPITGQPANKGPKVAMPPRYGRPKPYQAVRKQYINKWEHLAQTTLSEDTLKGLDVEIHHNGLNRSVGDVMLEFRDEIDSLRRVAQGAQTRHSDGEIRSMEKRWNEVYGGARDWAAVTDEEADDLVSFAVGQAIKGSRMVARGADANDVFAKGLRAVDKYLSYNRAIRLYGWAGGLQYIAMQGIGNAITGAIAKPSALPEYLYLNTKGLKAIKAWDQKTATPDQLPRLIKEFRRVGLMGNANIDTTFGTAFGIAGREGGPFNTPGSSQFKKNLGKLLAPRAIANDANARDLALRLAVGGATWDKEMSALLRPLADNAVQAKRAHGGWSAVPVPDSAIRERIARLKKDTGDRFTAAELRDALLELGEGLPRQRQDWNTYADRIARDYVNGLRTAQKAARDEVNRVAFPFQSTNADEVLSRLFMFHYWISRASVLYLNEAANNPWQLRSWMQAMEEANRQRQEQALPQWKSAFMKFMETPAGYAVHLDPTSLLGTYLFFAEQGGEKPMNDYTAFGKFFDDGPGGNLMLNPLIRAAVYVLGAGGADFKAGDVTGTGKLERKFTDAMNLANSLGEGFIRSEGGEPVPVAEIDQRKFMAWLAQYTSGRLPGTRQVDPYQYDTTFARTALIYGISNQLVEGDPDLKARLESPDPTIAKDAANQLEMATEEILLNPKHEYYRTAYDDYARSNFLGPMSDRGPLGAVAGAAIREVSPFRISTSIAEQDAARVRKKVLDAPTARDEEMGNLLWDTGDKRALNLAFERIGMNNWTGDFGVEALIAARNPGMSTTEILQLAAEARRDPDSAVMAEARRLNDAEGVVRQITGGAWEQGTLTVAGQSISQERLNALDSSDRWKWANAWLNEQGLLEAHEAFRQQKADFVKSEPLLQGWYGYKDAAENYPGGFDLWVRDTARVNPGFASVVEGLEKSGFLPGTDDFKDAVMKTGAYLRAEGADQYGGRANGNGRYAGVPEGQSLASWKIERGEEYDDNGYVAKKAEGILKDMKDVDAAFAKAEEYGYGEVFLMQLQTGDKDTYNLPYDVYQAVKQAAGGYVPSGRMSDVENYVTWIRQQPKGTYATEEEAVKAFVAQARNAEDIGGELPQESTGGSGETAAGSLFSSWQGADPDVLPATHEVQMADAAATGDPVLLSGAEYAYLRPAPGRDAGFLSVLAAGQAMTMLELVDVGGEKWARVQMPDGSEGYVLAAYVRR